MIQYRAYLVWGYWNFIVTRWNCPLESCWFWFCSSIFRSLGIVIWNPTEVTSSPLFVSRSLHQQSKRVYRVVRFCKIADKRCPCVPEKYIYQLGSKPKSAVHLAECLCVSFSDLLGGHELRNKSISMTNQESLITPSWTVRSSIHSDADTICGAEFGAMALRKHLQNFGAASAAFLSVNSSQIWVFFDSQFLLNNLCCSIPLPVKNIPLQPLFLVLELAGQSLVFSEWGLQMKPTMSKNSRLCNYTLGNVKIHDNSEPRLTLDKPGTRSGHQVKSGAHLCNNSG